MTRLLLLVVEFRLRLVSRRNALRGKREIIRHAHFDAAFGSEFVGMSIRIDRDSLQSLGTREFWHARRQASRALAKARYRRLQMSDVFLNPQRAQMFDCILANQLILARSEEHTSELQS